MSARTQANTSKKDQVPDIHDVESRTIGNDVPITRLALQQVPRLIRKRDHAGTAPSLPATGIARVRDGLGVFLKRIESVGITVKPNKASWKLAV